MPNPFLSARASVRKTLPLLLLSLSLAGVAQTAHSQNANAQAPQRLWYSQPASKWVEALPIGNGRLGAMVFGGLESERIQFNEDTLWRGKPHDYVREGSGDQLAEIRRLVTEGKGADAEKLVREKFLSDPVRQKAYQPFGDLRFSFSGHEKATNYQRDLVLESGLARVSYRVGDVNYSRETFASFPDNVIVVRLTADKAGALSFGFKMDSPHPASKTVVLGSDTLALSGKVEEGGLSFEGRARVIAEGGRIVTDGNGLKVEGATSATVILALATSFVNWQDISGDPARKSAAILGKVAAKSYKKILAAHLADHKKMFDRVSFSLGSTPNADLPTNERLTALKTDTLAKDPALAALYFQYGRYLLMGSSRPGSQPANLQGVWNEEMNPPWEGKWTTNINVEMNYWPAELGNLSECHEPLFDLIDDLRVSGARTAKKMYNARGWVLHHNTDLWRGTAPINNIDGVWPTGAAWLCHHMWEHYTYTGDKKFLAERAYPAMKEASLFFVDFLVKDPETGYMVTLPSHSPEQPPANRTLFSASPTMDNQLIRALFNYTIESSKILGKDKEFAAQITKLRDQLPPNLVGQHGQLQEWLHDWDTPNNNHRHMSPLWALYPGNDITPAEPKIWDATKVLLKWRGDGSTGWSYAWRIPLWARVGDGEFAYKQLDSLLNRRTLPNLFDLCGPFQIDGNFGAAAGIVEMLVQSHEIDPASNATILNFLPALPKAWPQGSIKGLKMRGGFEVGFQWQNGAITRAEIQSKLGKPCVVRYGDKNLALKTKASKKYIFDGQLKPVS